MPKALPTVSVFTPSHNSRFLDDCYRSLQAQTLKKWEWIVLLNGGATWKAPKDKRVKVVHTQSTGIGRLKNEACAECAGDVLVELDHDDYFLPEALKKVATTFRDNPEAVFVFSDYSQMKEDGHPNYDTFDQAFGWQYGVEKIVPPFDGVDPEDYLVTKSMPISPHNMSLIWYAPNHVRAFSASSYDAVGGYDVALTVLDDQDLMSRLFRLGEFVHIDECLYLQRVWDGNTQKDPDTNALIQQQTVGMYYRDIEPNLLAWAKREGLMAIDLGAAHGKPEGYMGLDIEHYEGIDFHGDVLEVLSGLPDNSVGVFRAVDFLEHIPDKIKLFNELYRTLAHGGMLLSVTPSTDGRGAFQDPTHVSFYNENSFWYYSDAALAQYVPAIETRFQVSQLHTYAPTEWHEKNFIFYVLANLIAIKDHRRQGGLLKI